MQPTQAFEEILAALAAQDDELDGLLAGLDDTGWATPSRCDGWSVSDVVLHLAQTDEMTVASAERRFTEATAAFGQPDAAGKGADVDTLAGLAVEAERGRPGPDVLARWRAASAAQAKALGAHDAGDRLPWVAGDLSALTLATTRLAEGWIHTGDVAAGLGRDTSPGDRLRPIVRLAWRTLPYAFQRAGKTLSGPVALELTATDGSLWKFTPDGDKAAAATTVTGPALDFCLLAARRTDPSATALAASGADGPDVLNLVRTFA